MSGPLPKRSDQRRRVNKVPGLEQAPGGKVTVPRADRDWHPIAADWFRSLARSGQSRFYEPSDWQYARMVAAQMSLLLSCPEPSAALLKAVLDGTKELLSTEGSRRRLRLELLRQGPQVDAAAVEAEADVADIVALAVAGA